MSSLEPIVQEDLISLAGTWHIIVSAEDRDLPPARLPHRPVPNPAGQEQESRPLREAGELWISRHDLHLTVYML